MKKILITGASGLVGRAVISELLSSEREYDIYAASSKVCNGDGNKVHYVLNNEIQSIFEKINFDVLLHLAFPRNVKEEYWADGFKFATDILWMAKKYKVARIINVSSQSIYGWKREKAAKEGDSVVLNSPYTTGKYFTELITEKLFDKGYYSNIR